MSHLTSCAYLILSQPELFNRAVVDACAHILGPAETLRASSNMPHAVEKGHTNESSEWRFKETMDAGGPLDKRNAPKAQ